MVDNVEIVVRAGRGGDGAVSLRREKFAPRGGPDGGDGGRGGDVIIVADRNMDDLGFFKSKASFHAEDGGNGGKNKRSGRKGDELSIKVPVGTAIWELAEEGRRLMADLSEDRASVVVASGGRGGKGNMHFATSTRQVPMYAEEGRAGEDRRLEAELRLPVDVALIGPPNSGRSSLLGRLSNAPVVVADYPYTTREPVLGRVGFKDVLMTFVELPPLVQGAHEGRGLGNRFLRHARRAAVILYLLDGAADLTADLAWLREEVARFDPALAEKRYLVAVNKVDLPEVESKLPAMKAALKKIGVKPCFISALTGSGVDELLSLVGDAVREAGGAVREVAEPVAVLRPKPKRKKARRES